MDDGAERATHLVKRPWTPEEDEALVAAVTKYGACRWSMIATHLESGRVGKQCRERWNNHLCPEVKKSDFSDEDDRAILIGVAELGTRWCEIVKRQPLVGRTDNAIKNRFYALQRRSKARYSGTWGRRELLPLSLSSPLGKRKEGGEAAAADAMAMPPPPPPEEAGRDSAAAEVINRREAIVAIATELAFATDEGERDVLIGQLTSALQAHGSGSSSPETDDPLRDPLGPDPLGGAELPPGPLISPANFDSVLGSPLDPPLAHSEVARLSPADEVAYLLPEAPPQERRPGARPQELPPADGPPSPTSSSLSGGWSPATITTAADATAVTATADGGDATEGPLLRRGGSVVKVVVPAYAGGGGGGGVGAAICPVACGGGGGGESVTKLAAAAPPIFAEPMEVSGGGGVVVSQPRVRTASLAAGALGSPLGGRPSSPLNPAAGAGGGGAAMACGDGISPEGPLAINKRHAYRAVLAPLKVPEMYGAVTALAPSGRSCVPAGADGGGAYSPKRQRTPTGFQFGVSPKHAAGAAAFAVPTLVVASNPLKPLTSPPAAIRVSAGPPSTGAAPASPATASPATAGGSPPIPPANATGTEEPGVAAEAAAAAERDLLAQLSLQPTLLNTNTAADDSMTAAVFADLWSPSPLSPKPSAVPWAPYSAPPAAPAPAVAAASPARALRKGTNTRSCPQLRKPPLPSPLNKRRTTRHSAVDGPASPTKGG